jgi:hypothetical protein
MRFLPSQLCPNRTNTYTGRIVPGWILAKPEWMTLAKRLTRLGIAAGLTMFGHESRPPWERRAKILGEAFH